MGLRRAGERGGRRERLLDYVVAFHIRHRNGVARGRDIWASDALKRGNGVDDRGQLAREPVQIVIGHVYAGKHRKARHI